MAGGVEGSHTIGLILLVTLMCLTIFNCFVFSFPRKKYSFFSHSPSSAMSLRLWLSSASGNKRAAKKRPGLLFVPSAEQMDEEFSCESEDTRGEQNKRTKHKGGKPRAVFISNMHSAFHGKRRSEALGKGFETDHSIIVLKLEQAESKLGTKKLRSKCIVCGKTMDNDKNSIMCHLKSQRHQLAESVQGEAQVMGEHLAFGGNAHRKATVDSYMLAYFCMREKIAFTLPAKLKETMVHLHCCDPEAVANMHLSRDTIARRCFKIGDYLQEQAKDLLESCHYASVMFDEASNIHMAGLLNIFVNALTENMEVIVLFLIYMCNVCISFAFR